MKMIPSVSTLYERISKNNLQKNSIETDELWYSRLIGRRLSIYFTWIMLRLGMTPNQATLVSFVFGIIGLVFLTHTSFLVFLFGFILFHLYIIIDSSDGEMARFLEMKSKRGAFYDKLLHYVMRLGILIVISLQVYARTHDQKYIIGGLVLALLSSFTSTFYYLLPKNNLVSYSEQVREQGYLMGWLRKIFRTLTGDIELSIVLFVLVLVCYFFQIPLVPILVSILLVQFVLLVLYVVQQVLSLIR